MLLGEEMMDRDEIEAFRRGTFAIDCLSMKLEKVDGDGSRVFSGSGYIRQEDGYQLAFKQYSTQSPSPNEAFGGLFDTGRVKAGQIIPENEYFSLTAVDIKGRTWKSSRVLPTPESNLELEGSVWTGRPDLLACSRDCGYDLDNYLVLEFLGDYEIPFNTPTKTIKTTGSTEGKIYKLDTLDFASGNIGFRLKQEENALVVMASLGNMPASYLETRITETLQFSLAREVAWALLHKREGHISSSVLRSGRYDAGPSGLRAPLGRNLSSSCTPFIHLFDRYLQYILPFAKDQYHPISKQIRAVCRAGAMPLEAKALTLSVAIEGILKSSFEDYGRVTDEEKAEIRRLQEYLNKWDGLVQLRDRAQGSIGNMRYPRALDQMKDLERKGIITGEQIEIWRKVRNTSAHAEPLDSADYQEVIQRYNTLIVLLHWLVFFLIGYSGKYVDYGTLNWPLRDYVPGMILATQPLGDDCR